MQFYSPNDWVSVYRNDFVPFPSSRDNVKKNGRASSQPLFAPYFQYLKVKDCKREPNEPSETTSDFLKRNPILAEKYFKKPLDTHIICRDFDRKLLSLYQRDFCHEENIIQRGKRTHSNPYVRLPNNWQYPTTTNNESYRHPKTLTDLDVRGHLIKPDEKDGFTFSNEMANIMKIKTGKTVYRKYISDLGKFIIDHAMHGEITK